MDIFKYILDNNIGITDSDLTSRPNFNTDRCTLLPIIKQILEFFASIKIQVTLSGGYVNFALGFASNFGDLDFFINSDSNLNEQDFVRLALILNTGINIQYYPSQANRYCLIPIHSIYLAILSDTTRFQFIFVNNIPNVTHVQSFAYLVVSSFDICFVQKALVLVDNQLSLLSLPNDNIFNIDYLSGFPLIYDVPPQVTHVFKKTIYRLAKH